MVYIGAQDLETRKVELQRAILEGKPDARLQEIAAGIAARSRPTGFSGVGQEDIQNEISEAEEKAPALARRLGDVTGESRAPISSFFVTSSGSRTYRVGTAPAPKNALQISQKQYYGEEAITLPTTREELIVSLSERLKGKGALKGIKIETTERDYAIIPESAVYHKGFTKQLKKFDIFRRELYSPQGDITRLNKMKISSGRKLILTGDRYDTGLKFPSGKKIFGTGYVDIPISAAYHPGFKQYLGSGRKYDTLSLWEKSQFSFARTNEKFANAVTRKIFPKLSYFDKRAIAGEESIIRKWERTHLPTWLAGEKVTEKQLKKSMSGGAREVFYGSLRDRPLYLAGSYALFAGINYAVGAVGTGLALKGVVISRPVKYAYSYGVPAIYGAVKVKQYLSAKTPRAKGLVIGKTVTYELVPMALGGSAGGKLWQKTSGWWRTRGREYIPAERIVSQDVLSGQELFQTSTRSHKKIFTESTARLPGDLGEDVNTKKVLAGWHAESTAKPSAMRDIMYLPKGKSGLVLDSPLYGAREIPGAYVSPELSPYFLRTGQLPTQPYALDLFSTGIPTAGYIKPFGIKSLTGTLESMGSFMRSEATKGFFYTHPATAKGFYFGKSEVEAIIPPGSKLMKTGSKYYTVWQGIKVPIEQFSAVKGLPSLKTFGGKSTSGATKFLGIGDVNKMLSYKGSAVITPFSLAAAYKIAVYKPSSYRASYRTSYKPSYKVPTYTQPYRVPYNIPNYNKPYNIPYKPSYKPSYKAPTYAAPYKSYKEPAYVTPYTPSYTYKQPYKIPDYRIPVPEINLSFSGLIFKKREKKQLKRQFKYQPTLTSMFYGGKNLKVFSVPTGFGHRLLRGM